jgi:salicylate hydroxylase
MLGKYEEPRFSGNSAYRTLIHRSELENDAELAPLLDINTQTSRVW